MPTKKSIAVLAISLSALIAVPTLAQADLPDHIKQFQSSFPIKDVKRLDKVKDLPKGLRAWGAISPEGESFVFYDDPETRTLIIGAMVRDGKVLSQEHAKYAPRLDYTKLFKDKKDLLDKYGVIPQGNPNADVVVYAFFEPHCGFCHKAWLMFNDMKDDVFVKWIPVAFLSADSPDYIQAIIGYEKGAAQGLIVHEETFPNSGLEPVPATQETLAMLQETSKLMRDFGFKGTPALVYENSKGGVSVHKGLPRDVEALKKDLGVE